MRTFTALILIVCGHFSDAVPPPSNVRVKCENLNITVSWDYRKHQPQTIFRVIVTGSTAVGSFEERTAAHQYDISQFVLDSQERYLSYLIVDVTAVQGGEQSEAVKSKSFSFNQLISVDIKCLLDFPPVNVHKAEDGVKFPNPLSLYDELKRTVQPNSNAAFRFRVFTSAGTEFIGSCGASDVTCKLDMTLSAEECVTLKVKLFFDKPAGQIAFKETERYCAKKQGPEVDGLVMFGFILGSIFLIIIIVAVVVICKVEAWNMKTPVPKIQVNSQGNGEQQSFFIPNREPEKSPVSVSTPGETMSLFSEDQNFCEQPEPNNNDGDDYDCRGKENYAGGGCLEDSSPNLDAEGFVSGTNGTDDESPDGSVKTECISISSAEEEGSSMEEVGSPYDRPHVYFQRELGDGEPVTGYGGN